MKRDAIRRRRRGPATTEYHPDTADVFGQQPTFRGDRKLQQLCHQVEEHLALVLAGEVDDPVLQDLYIHDVIPEPGGSRLVVRLARTPGSPVSLSAALPRLEALRPFLRGEVAAAIHRKRTPDLLFTVLLDAPTREEGDA